MVDSVFLRGDLHVYPEAEAPKSGGFAPPWGGGSGPSSYIGVSDYFVEYAWDIDHKKKIPVWMDLQLVLAHEGDHLWGISGHIDPDSAYTVYTKDCSGL